MQRFRSLKTLQKFSSVHAQVHNHFNQERHLITRQIYKQRRSIALAEWRALAAQASLASGRVVQCDGGPRYFDDACGRHPPSGEGAVKTVAPKRQRCAIYTRKSTEHNLDLVFNSLYPQRESVRPIL
jgi:hypothetical protein